MTLDDKQRSDFTQFGRIIARDDPAVLSQLELAAADVDAWGTSNWSGWDDWDEVESRYPKVMIQVLEPFLIGFWHNMGDLTAWVVGAASARGLGLDRESVGPQLKAVEGTEWPSRWAFVEAAINATASTLKQQGLRLYMVPNPYEDPVYACVVTEPEGTQLDALTSWTDGADLYQF